MTASGSFVFNGDGQLTKIHMSEIIDNLVKSGDTVLEKVKGDLEEEINFTFGVSEISLPDFSNFEVFPIQNIMQLIGNTISSLPISPAVPLPSPIVQPVED